MEWDKKSSKRSKRLAILLAAVALTAVVLAVFLLPRGGADTALFQEKVERLQQEALADWVRVELGISPAGEAGNVVFLSVCDGRERASVYTGIGDTIDDAWENAVRVADKALKKSGLEPRWVKADVVYVADTVTAEELRSILQDPREEGFRYGIAFDDSFGTALLEAELNGVGICDFDKGEVDLGRLNSYLETSGGKVLEALPERYSIFQCVGWLCDEDKEVYALSASGQDYGRRQVETIDADHARSLVLNASLFLKEQVQEAGSFFYGIYPCSDTGIEGYDIVHHVGAIWSLLCRYRLEPDAELKEKLDQTIRYMLDQVIYDQEGRAYLCDEKDGEVKLGGCGIAVVVLTEYMDIFGDDRYKDVCQALGEGILAMQDASTGRFDHVLNGDLTRKEEYRTASYDGAAVFALCRLYGLTGVEVWLDAARSAVDHFIQEDYAQYKDQWVAYGMEAITKYIPEEGGYYAFALENVQKNLETIYDDDTTDPADLELLIAAFEVYDRMIEHGGTAEGFDMELFLKTIYAQAERMLNGYFFPEYAMYMEDPQKILDTFMVRHDGFRVRIDDVQHNIGGYYLYYKNYDKLVEYGMLECRD